MGGRGGNSQGTFLKFLIKNCFFNFFQGHTCERRLKKTDFWCAFVNLPNKVPLAESPKKRRTQDLAWNPEWTPPSPLSIRLRLRRYALAPTAALPRTSKAVECARHHKSCGATARVVPLANVD